MAGTSQGSSSVPVGTIIWYPALTPPVGWLVCNGQSTVGYPALAAIVGYNVPDLRGEFIRGADLGRGIDSGRLFGSVQGDAIRNIIGEFSGSIARVGTGAFKIGTPMDVIDSGSHWTSTYSFDASRVVPTANENRPRNIALLPCIKY